MGTIGDLLNSIIGIFGMGTSNLILKIIVSILAISGFIFGVYLKRKLRKQAADRDIMFKKQRSKKQNIKIEKQNTKDGSTVRDRLRRK